MNIIELMQKAIEEHTPKTGADVVGIDDFELPGEELYLIKHFENLKDAEKFAKTLKVKYTILEGKTERAEKAVKPGFVAPVGQYYNDQPISQPKKPFHNPVNPTRRVGIAQPPQYTDTNPSNLGSSRAVPGRDTFDSGKDQIHCPICGQPTLSVLNALEPMPEDIRCTQCGARFKSEDLLNAKLMEEISNVLRANNSVDPISIPALIQKSFTKEMDIDLKVKDYCGFDTSKSIHQAAQYANTPAYKRLIREYLSDLSATNRNRIVDILKNGLKGGKSVREITNYIAEIIKDKERAELIAKTEIVRLGNEGNLTRIEEKGTEQVEFISAPEDGRLCEHCKALDRKIFTIKEARGIIPVHPRCRCLFTEHYGTEN